MPEGLSTGRKNCHIGQSCEKPTDSRSYRRQEMFTIVQNKQYSLTEKCVYYAGKMVVSGLPRAHGIRNSGPHVLRVADCSQVNEANPVPVGFSDLVRHGNGDCGFSDTAWTHDCSASLFSNRVDQLSNLFGSSDYCGWFR